MSPFRARIEELADDALVVVRGGGLDTVTIRSDASAAAARFGEHGISVFSAVDETTLDALARDRLAQFDILVLMTAGAIRGAGLELRPTFRRPHYTIMLPDLDRDIERLVACDNVRMTNPHHVRSEEER
ncbi:MAG: hypothetical protein QOF30_1490 [Acidimicrobiaceae bacterium]|nr:hypothetical protein [Acidimicrobiaceae bacterium]